MIPKSPSTGSMRSNKGVPHTAPTLDGRPTLEGRRPTLEVRKLDAGVQHLSWRRLYLAKAKLKQASNISALLAGFAMVAMVEAPLGADLPEALLVIFSVSTTLVVVVHLVAVMVSTCILPDIEAIGDSDQKGDVKLSPHDAMARFVELAWIFSTGLGIFLFLGQMGVLVWIRFYPRSIKATVAAMVIVAPAIVMFALFSMRYYNRLIRLKYRRSAKEISKAEALISQMEEALPLVNPAQTV